MPDRLATESKGLRSLRRRTNECSKVVALARLARENAAADRYVKAPGGTILDTLTRAERSERMSRIRAKNTRVELLVRRLVFSMGFRYRLHDRRLPGQPDLVLPRLRKVIFVHGCFWHLHLNCRQYKYPQSRLDFWEPKLTLNRRRDEDARGRLRRLGWKVLTVWECQLKDEEKLKRRLSRFLVEDD